ncbi:MAG: hypothetical protein EON52_10780 [Actinomycetales bacterium]|nr:MAG: hypothetical protein EON52_10780 [Actinomycetales bacterium]
MTRPSATSASSAAPSASAEPTERPVRPMVLAISVDGLNPEAIERLGRSGTPNLHRLLREGASTLEARTAQELTITLPNHTGMLTGRAVGGEAGHSVTFNDDDGGTLAATHGSYVPGLFDVAHDHGLRTAFLAEKDKFGFLMRSWDAEHGAADRTGEDDGRDKTDIDLVDEEGSTVVDRVRTIVGRQQADLVFLHLKAPDQAGHARGWLSPAYLDAVRSVDRDLGRVLDTIESTPAVRDRLTLLLTADHGGPQAETKHDDMTLRANYRIPFVAWGRGVERGADLYDLSPGRADPGTGRPGYDGAQPVRNLDLARTALRALGLDAIEDIPSSRWPPVLLR